VDEARGVRVEVGVAVRDEVAIMVWDAVRSGVRVPALALAVVIKEGVVEGGMRVAVRDGVGITVNVRVGVKAGVRVGVAEATGVDVRAGVLDATGVRVGVNDGGLVSVIVGVEVIVGGSPVKVKDAEAFHSLPMKMRTSYVPGSHFSAGCCQNEYSMPLGA
jgi:hypothetical protein